MSSEAFTLVRPVKQSGPVLFSSPHSGRDYPAAFRSRSRLAMLALRSSEDAFVDRLFAAAPGYGAPLLSAQAPRAYLDLNRSSEELDPAVVEGAPKIAQNPRISSGLGVIPRVVANGRAIYEGRISLAEAEARLQRLWHPYHNALRALMEETHQQFGRAVLIDCHSMPHEAIESQRRPGVPGPEVVLGDRFGAAAGREVTDALEAAFVRAGLRVARNAPFAGAYITQAYGRPLRGQHVVQVEIDRSLYMDEQRIEPHDGFADFRALISGVIAEVTSGFAQSLPLAAE
jgi:N-formylglutamate amidohydrolase